jgi:hypothetical protein
MQGYRAGLAELVRGPEWLDSVELGAVEHVAIALGEHESVTCVQSGLWLVSDDDGAVVVSLRSEDRGMGESLRWRSWRVTGRERIVLPDGVLERIERQAFGIADHAERLRASGRHLRHVPDR